VEIRQIKAFILVAQTSSFTQSADRLNISQPSLSARIRGLEKSLNGVLIDRLSRPVRLTPLGEAFLPYAERALAILEAASELAEGDRLKRTLQLKIACPFSVATYLIPGVVDLFGQKFPQAELDIETGNSDFAVSQLVDGVINLAFAAAFPKFLVQTQILLRLHDEMSVAVSPQHELAGSTNIPISEIWPYRVLLIHWGPAFRTYIESLRQISPQPGPLVRLPLAGALPMARQPDTITFMPRRLVTASGLTGVQVDDFSYAWDVALLTRLGRTLSHLEGEFVRIVTEVWKLSHPVS